MLCSHLVVRSSGVAVIQESIHQKMIASEDFTTRSQ
eukprot:COSAG02_NODE_49039_length_329_cov_1.365217_1_plen_35_part_01